MLTEVEADRVSTIIVKDLSRFSRNSVMAGMFINFTFAEYGVRFIAINDNYDTIDPNSIDNDFAGIKNWFNDFMRAIPATKSVPCKRQRASVATV